MVLYVLYTVLHVVFACNIVHDTGHVKDGTHCMMALDVLNDCIGCIPLWRWMHCVTEFDIFHDNQTKIFIN